MSIVKTSLPAYVEQHNSDLIAKMVFGARTTKYLTPMLGVKGKSALHLLATSVTLGNGAACGWNEAGTSTLTDRNLVTKAVKVNMAFCDKTLIQTYAEYDVRIAAGQKTLPYEENFINDVLDKYGYKLDQEIWQDSTNGLLALAAADSAVIGYQPASGTSKINAVNAALLAMPVDIINGNAVIFCSPEFARGYKLELIAANLFHYDPTADADEIVIPGSVVRLVAVPGLTGQKKMFGCNLEEVFYGTDTADDASKFEFWYSQDNREFRLAIEGVVGAQYAFGDHIVLVDNTNIE